MYLDIDARQKAGKVVEKAAATFAIMTIYFVAACVNAILDGTQLGSEFKNSIKARWQVLFREVAGG
jgi:hypothetical protein